MGMSAVGESRGLKRPLDDAASVAQECGPSPEAAAGAGACSYCSESKEDWCVFGRRPTCSTTDGDEVPMPVDVLHRSLIIHKRLGDRMVHRGGLDRPATQRITGDLIARLLRA